ncbi:MAG: lipopolysaccharide biosynthesis protein [Vicinamibacterales bacterium]
MVSTVRQRLLRNTAWNYIGFAVNLAVNVLLFPLAIARMGDAATGVWLLIGSVSGYMGLLQLGLTPAMGQFAAMHIARRDDDGLARTVSTALALVSGFGAMALLALPAVPWMLDWFSVPAEIRGEASTAFVLGIVGVPLQMPGHVFNAVLGASQRQDRSTQVWMVSLSGKLIGIAALLMLGYGVAAVMWLETALILIADVMLMVLAFDAAPQLRLSRHSVSADDARQLLGLGGWMFVNSLASLLIENTDRIVIGVFLSVVAVTPYAAAWKIYMLAYSVCTTLVQAVWPAAAALHAHGDVAGLQRLFLRMTKYCLVVAWPLTLSLGLSAALVLRVWMGPAFAEHYAVVQVLLACFVVAAHNHVGMSILAAMRLVRPVVLGYSLPQALLNLLLSIWLIQHLGILGVALGTFIPIALLQVTLMPMVLGAVQLGWDQLWRDVVRPTAAPALIAYAPTVLVYAANGPHSPWVFASAVASGVVYAAMVWHVTAPGERQELAALVPVPFRRFLAE